VGDPRTPGSAGQRRLRDLPRHAQEGAHLPAIVADARRGQDGDL
jgi:hypothetical protein